jgi:NAD(P) transhydrogenase subunit alpha
VVQISADFTESEYTSAKPTAIFIGQFAPFANPGLAEGLAARGVNAFSLDMIPRTSLAQSMDILSSMASIAGYHAVLSALNHLPRYMPMMITAAGSIKPSKVLVIGAGVAGLQAIATARRLGAVVEAFDTRSAVKEEVQSLGAKFVEVAGARDDASAGGYAVEQTEEYKVKQAQLIQDHATTADIVITTAQLRGKPAPLLIKEDTVKAMKPGSVIVDLAASTGGNCAGTKDKQIIRRHDVTIIGDSSLYDRMPQDASVLYSNNVFNFLKHIVRNKAIDLHSEDEILSKSLISKKA